MNNLPWEKYNWIIGIGIVLVFLSIPAAILIFNTSSSASNDTSLNLLNQDSKLVAKQTKPAPTFETNTNSYNIPLPSVKPTIAATPKVSAIPSPSSTPTQTPTSTPQPNNPLPQTPVPTPTINPTETPTPTPTISPTPNPS